MIAPISAEPVDNRREDRRLAIIDAAETLFLEQGFERTSLAAIIKKSGGSLATVYDLFGNKQGLLRAVVERRRDEAMSDIEGVACELDSCAEMLRLYAHRLHTHMTSPQSVALIRIVITESMRDPEFARAFHNSVREVFVRQIFDAFAAWTAAGRADIDDPEAAAELFLSIVISDAQLRAMTQLGLPPLDNAAIDWRLAPFLTYFKLD